MVADSADGQTRPPARAEPQPRVGAAPAGRGTAGRRRARRCCSTPPGGTPSPSWPRSAAATTWSSTGWPPTRCSTWTRSTEGAWCRRRVPRWSEFSELIRPRPVSGERGRAPAGASGDRRGPARGRPPHRSRGPSSTTPTAPPARSSAWPAPARRSAASSSGRACCATSPTVDPRRRSSARPAALPLVFAPTGFTRLMHTEGEPAVARVAERTGIPYALSTMGTTSMEALAAAAPGARRWFQLYLWRDREASAAMVERAHATPATRRWCSPWTPRSPGPGCATSATASRSRRRCPCAPWPTPRCTRAGGSTCSPPSRSSSPRCSSWGGTIGELVDRVFEPAATLADVERLRADWPGRARRQGRPGRGRRPRGGRRRRGRRRRLQPRRPAARPGADARWSSCPGSSRAVGDRAEVYLDGGILDGADVVAAVAIGARACLVGRAYLYGLMAGGERGVQRAADILAAEIARTLQLLGVPSVGPAHAGSACALRPGHCRRRGFLGCGMDVVEVVPAREQYAFTFGGVAAAACASARGRRCGSGRTTPSAGRCSRPRTSPSRRSTCAS